MTLPAPTRSVRPVTSDVPCVPLAPSLILTTPDTIAVWVAVTIGAAGFEREAFGRFDRDKVGEVDESFVLRHGGAHARKQATCRSASCPLRKSFGCRDVGASHRQCL